MHYIIIMPYVPKVAENVNASDHVRFSNARFLRGFLFSTNLFILIASIVYYYQSSLLFVTFTVMQNTMQNVKMHFKITIYCDLLKIEHGNILDSPSLTRARSPILSQTRFNEGLAPRRHLSLRNNLLDKLLNLILLFDLSAQPPMRSND